MRGRWWRFWTDSPTSGSVTSVKQEQEKYCLGTRKSASRLRICPVICLSALSLLLLVTCVALSVLYNYQTNQKRPEWKSFLFDFQNISNSYLVLSEANSELRRENYLLKERHALLEEQIELLNRTSITLISVNHTLSLERVMLMEQIGNLTSTNSQLTQEHRHLVHYTSKQEEEKQNMSKTIKDMVNNNAQREEEEQRLIEVNGLLGDELFQVKEQSQELLQTNNRFQEEINNLNQQVNALLSKECEDVSKHSTEIQERVISLQEQNQDLRKIMMKERQEAEEREEKRRNEINDMVADMHSVKDAYRSLDLYCPVVDQETRERHCKTCQDGWRLFEKKCYYFSSDMLTWNSSRAWCQTQGGDLVVINSELEHSFLFKTTHTLDESSTRLWIGMTDAKAEGEWLWVDGSSVASDVQFWLTRPGEEAEPDDWKLNNSVGEDCGHIDTSEALLMSWMDGACTISYRWICEKTF
ncbi:CD209 antigen-like protein B isoform X2 [Antennarius striatus]|uniref:CD209 antigen-like protein B isoform X2 n=1 Tax=Antennarius striatus TaxID=241820 RepID=UPI0035B282FE